MNLRDTISNLYHLLHNKKDKIFMFFIGSYPHRPESNHELPKIYNQLLKLYIPIYRLYIDPNYSTEPNNNIINRLGKDFLIHNNNISPSEYSMIIEFCHIAGITGNSLSIIMEFTGIDRTELYKKDSITNYLYITPSDCLGDTENILYNPIIEEKENNKYGFFNPDKIEMLSKEIIKLKENTIKLKENTIKLNNLSKIELLQETLKIRLNDVGDIYRLLFNYMKRKDIFDVTHEINFIKDKTFFYKSLDLLKMRMGYNTIKTEEIIEDFLKSDEIDFEIYIKQKIQNIFIDCLILECKGDDILVNNQYDNILFDTPDEVYQIYQKLLNIFQEVNII